MNETLSPAPTDTGAPDPDKTSLTRLDRLRLLAIARGWWRRNFVKSVDQHDAIRRVKDEGGHDGRYLFMIAMSAGIAVMGLILSSPAVVIGAMLLSPLMGPIVGAGFALASWDVRWLRETANSLFVGVLTAIAIAALISWMSPIQTITSEIASRTRPNLLDLAVALFSGLAGAYAMIKGRQGTIVGVAIATALMPPLAVVGFGLATMNWAVFGGALMLFITNLITIAATSAGMARLYGFSTKLSKQHTLIQSLVILFALFLLAIPLTISLSQIAEETRANRLASQIMAREFDPRARFDPPVIDFESDPISLSAAVFTPRFEDAAEARVERQLSEALGEPVAVAIEQFRVPVNAAAAQEAELAAARSRAQAEAAQAALEDLTDRLALVAGVERSAIVIDRDKRLARVRARPIEGATLGAYRDLEARVAERAPGWTVELVPPARALPVIRVDDKGTPAPAAIALVAWAQQRLESPVALDGPTDQVEAARKALVAAGATRIVTGDEEGTSVTPRWAAADAVVD